MEDNLNKITQIISPIILEEGCELLDLELVFENGHKILRVYLDKVAGVLLEDCQRVSHAIGDILEVKDCVKGQYRLEVSSPGLNRPLKTRKHFEAVVGKTVLVITKEKIEGRRKYRGTLKAVDQDILVIHIDQADFRVPLAQLSKANLEYSFT